MERRWPGSEVSKSTDRDLNESQSHEHCPKPELTLTPTLTLTLAQSLEGFFYQAWVPWCLGHWKGKTERSSWGERSMATWDTEQGMNKLNTYSQSWLSWAERLIQALVTPVAPTSLGLWEVKELTCTTFHKAALYSFSFIKFISLYCAEDEYTHKRSTWVAWPTRTLNMFTSYNCFFLVTRAAHNWPTGLPWKTLG